jgi:hypothetical protein
MNNEINTLWWYYINKGVQQLLKVQMRFYKKLNIDFRYIVDPETP